jgi:hypothetical protein
VGGQLEGLSGKLEVSTKVAVCAIDATLLVAMTAVMVCTHCLVPIQLSPFCFIFLLATTNVVADICIISDDITFKRFSVTNFNSYLRRHMSSLISINSDNIKGRRYLVFTHGLIATMRSDGHSRR